jgi:CRISPR-associated endonuclease/helicase Cas3
LVIAQTLRANVGEETDVVLLTGRMRPFDRDDLLAKLRPRVQTGRTRGEDRRKLIVVGTQCIEAGADFDFDALVTESASFDALRQRFGRVDRLGVYGSAEGVVVHDKSEKDDPVYGRSIDFTVKWLAENTSGKQKRIDFGSLALPPAPVDALSPRDPAPTLLPAYLDLWAQTSPEPEVVPDVGLFLHGPRSGPADVQVVWRVDLSDEDLSDADIATSVVGAVHPSSLEAVSLPFVVARAWLSEHRVMDTDVSDAEVKPDIDRNPPEGGKLALRWAGDRSVIISARTLRPGDTIVVPAMRGGIAHGSFEPGATESVVDLAERAALLGRGQPVLRLHGDVLAQLGLADVPLEDLSEARETLRVREETDAPAWQKVWLSAVAKSRQSLVVERGKDAWTVMLGARLAAAVLRERVDAAESAEEGVELTTDEDDSFYAGVAVTLADHSRDVEHFALDYAAAIGLPDTLVGDLALAAWLHDIGKADPRFQRMLRGGSEIDYFRDEGVVLAKSAMPPGAKAAHRVARARSGYPAGARHEVQSLAMLETRRDFLVERAHDLDLVLHLVASHHGHCRPFAPAIGDLAPVELGTPGCSSRFS